MKALVLLICALIASAAAQQPGPDYRNASLPVPLRVADLIARMTLEEKVEQISGGRRYELLDNSGQYTPEQAKEAFQKFRSLDVQVSPHDAAVLRNAAQRFHLEKTRLGIPALFMGEALHGFMEYGSTSFPQVLGLASTWDLDLVHSVFTAAGDEMRSAGVDQAFSPVLDLARDPRWGRTEETSVDEPTATVDDVAVAQFLYVLRHNQRLQSVIDAVSAKIVLILGNFGLEQKVVRRRDPVGSQSPRLRPGNLRLQSPRLP